MVVESKLNSNFGIYRCIPFLVAKFSIKYYSLQKEFISDIVYDAALYLCLKGDAARNTVSYLTSLVNWRIIDAIHKKEDDFSFATGYLPRWRIKLKEGKKAWRAKNLDRDKENKKRWIANNLDKMKEYKKAWRARNPDKVKEMKRAWRAKVKLKKKALLSKR